MKDEIKELLDSLDFQVNHTKNWVEPLGLDQKTWKELLDYITNLQDTLKDREEYCYGLETELTNLQEENERLKAIAHKMHLWIFLHCGDEQKVYDELGLTDEENAMLGYSGQFRIGDDK